MVCLSIHAAPYVLGEGRFYRRDGDSSLFVQKQLLYNAFKDAITREIDGMGLDSGAFWNNYRERFEESFKPVGENLKKGFLDGSGRLSRSARAKFEKALRFKRLSSMNEFGGLDKIVSSYAIKDRASSLETSPHSYRMTINARVDRKILHRTYLLFTSHRRDVHFERLFISVDVRARNIDGFSLGTGRTDSFAKVVLDNWGGWFRKHMSDGFEEIIPLEDVGSMGLDESLRKSTSFTDSLWLKISIHMEQTGEDRLFGYGDFVTKVDFLLLDLTTNAVMAHADLEEIKVRLGLRPEELISELAGVVHRRPLEEFSKIRDSIGRFSSGRARFDLTVGNATNLLDVIELSEYLSDKGIVLGVAPHISRYDGTEALITLGFTGGRESFLAFLKGLNKKTFADRKMLVVVNEGHLNILKMPNKDG